MSKFQRRQADRWHQEVPGARWFKADLHVHTLDDLPGGRVKAPPAIAGDPRSEANIRRYARLLLQAAAQRGVRVLGLTPHSARMATDEASAVWAIVDEWNDGIDDDGKPFRNKIYAVFPGFEPSLAEGRSGLHLIFIFDPEIGQTDYLRAFDLVMGQREPWRGNELQISRNTAADAFEALSEFRDRENRQGVADGCSTWDYLSLAPHIDSEKGIFGAEKGQILARFPVAKVAGLELPDEKLPDDALAKKPWLLKDMGKHRQAFFHGSDAYSPQDIGRRFTWMKLARPRIEGLRQAFLAADSRIRIAYRRQCGGGLVEIDDHPDVTVSPRPWLKSVRISGGASFFRNEDGSETRFDLSPDLTCVIGGSMTGKSTLLDGLRVQAGAPLPTNDHLNRQVLARGRDGFLAGAPSVKLECPGQDPTGALNDNWPAEFYAQNELQRLAQDPNAVEDILSRLVAEETGDISSRTQRLAILDDELARLAKQLDKLDQDFADAEQGVDRASRAASELADFAAAGIDELHGAAASHDRWRRTAAAAEDALADARGVRVGELPEDLEAMPPMPPAAAAEDQNAIYDRIAEVRSHLNLAAQGLADLVPLISDIVAAAERREAAVREQVERKLAGSGLDGAAIKAFSSLSRQAALLDSRKALQQALQEQRDKDERRFERLLDERKGVIDEQRRAFDRVTAAIQRDFSGKIRARRQSEGLREPLEAFLVGLKQKGVTRWWNGLEGDERPSPRALLDGLRSDGLAAVGMSQAVQQAFRDAMTAAKRRALAAIRCDDRYFLELEVGDGEHRPLDGLSGGQRVSILLSLLLETADQRPLVIDQPEDECDNRFLFDTVLPALKRLKGRRQIVIATHNPNIVVNGDADQVIQLHATANNGGVAQAGAIEDAAVRDAIMQTVDGGAEAFRLRRLKYGF